MSSILRRVDSRALANFILVRQQETGGYASVPSLPATIKDTFQALELLAIINQPDNTTDKAALRHFLKKYVGITGSLPPRLLFYIDRITTLAGNYFIPPDKIMVCHNATAEDIFYLSQIPCQSRMEQHKRQVPAWRLCRELYFSLSLNIIAPADYSSIYSWLCDCQNGDGGFGFFPGTTSYIENSHYCLASLAIIDREPANKQAAIDFIISCQTKAGGFARTGKAAPFLDSSWHAMLALQTVS